VSADNLSKAALQLENACADENARKATRLIPKVEDSLTEVFAAYDLIAADLANTQN